ncbi:alpha/beta fold hydrolase [Hoeflea sp. YIM 152468]|uniref:alpha/beta hydrolase family protein n=1 Tax=Hoeflea sp. YIM 152468 TaxID=3031759 RepID=UPI0023DA9513|nr:alpha/beta fold hydrolase [Hoeflea sp. YIM 152468]MDF1609374.1 alpha/beta fold hydrolase [Hoeflea sp. YIM 152468]
MKKKDAQIKVDGVEMAGHFFEPATGFPGVLFVHGWAGSQKRDERRSRAIAQLGCICLTFDMRGHGDMHEHLKTVTPAENLADVCSAYDALARHPGVDSGSIAVVASSYGAYLATLLTSCRSVRWLGMRVPALYEDEAWEVAKYSLDRKELQDFRSAQVPVRSNRALRSCTDFQGDVLIVESENDHLIPHATIASYIASFVKARSITHRLIEDADHALSTPASRHAYDDLLLGWIREMVLNAR